MSDAKLKPLSNEAVPRALEKAMRYRLLNEPAEAESICLDILETEPDHQEALVTLLLAITDRFGRGYGVAAGTAEDVLPRIRDPYERAYYAGVIAERRAKTQLRSGVPGFVAAEGLREAMEWYEKAEAIRPAGNDDAILRWNACFRIRAANAGVEEQAEDRTPMFLE